MRTPLILLLVLAVLPGCSLFADEAEPVPAAASEAAAPDASATATAPEDVPTDTATPPAEDDEGDPPDALPDRAEIARQGTAATCAAAGEEFCEDADGNGWPDFVEEAIGRDPAVDDCAQAQCADVALEEFLAGAQDNTVFVLDASGSMAGDAGGVTKMEAAKEALVDYVSITPEFADLGLVVYGHRGDNSDAGRPESCAGIDVFAPVGELTSDNAEEVVGQFQATGWTPIAEALAATGPLLQQASEADVAEGVEQPVNRVILISDGIETCDGDPVAAATALQDLGVQVVVDVIGFDLVDADADALRAVADATGGVFSEAADRAGLREVFAQYAAQRRALLDVIGCLISAEDEASGCRTELYTEASDHLFALADELMADEATRARGQFIERWTLTLLQEDSDAQDALFEANSDRLAELESQLEEAFADGDAFEDANAKIALASLPRCPRAVTSGRPGPPDGADRVVATA